MLRIPSPTVPPCVGRGVGKRPRSTVLLRPSPPGRLNSNSSIPLTPFNPVQIPVDRYRFSEVDSNPGKWSLYDRSPGSMELSVAQPCCGRPRIKAVSPTYPEGRVIL